jgi:hypothetical protein
MSRSMDLDSLWDKLLSRRPELIRAAFEGLSPSEQGSVLAHLGRMTSEPGWHPEQRASASAALIALEQLPDEGN